MKTIYSNSISSKTRPAFLVANSLNVSRFEKEDDDKLNSYFLSLLNGLTVIFLSISILGFIFRYEIADIFGVVNQDLFVKVFTPIIFSQVFFFSGAIMMAYQYFKNEFK